MSTVSSLPAAFESRLCNHKCGRLVRVGVGFDGDAVCELCHQADVSADAHKLLCEVRSLSAGEPPFDCLAPEDRAEILADIISAGQPETLKYPGLMKADNQTLIDIASDPRPFCTAPGDDPHAMLGEAVAELARRLTAPTDAERESIESICAQMDADHREEAERWDGLA